MLTDDPAVAEAARLIGDHQRRHPTVNGCCCGWQGNATITWREHVARELRLAGLLPPTVTPAVTSSTSRPW